jgi:aminopeptidase S
MRTTYFAGLAFLALSLGAVGVGCDDGAGGGVAGDMELDRAEALSLSVTPEALGARLLELQMVADGNMLEPGTRDAAATRTWARRLLEVEGFAVEEQPFVAGDYPTDCPASCAGANLVATWPGEPDGRVLLVGAHLDGRYGPAINDDGTGVAAVVELAVQSARLGIVDEVPLRFVLFDREENGRLGSRAFVGGVDVVPLKLTPGPVAGELLGFINLDRIGSSNGVPGVVTPRTPAASVVLTDAVDAWFVDGGSEVVRFDLTKSGSSDHLTFAEAGIPAVWLFAGGTSTKTAEEARLYGGVAGAPYSDCDHGTCDGAESVDLALMTDLTKGAAWAVGRVAGKGALAEAPPVTIGPIGSH